MNPISANEAVGGRLPAVFKVQSYFLVLLLLDACQTLAEIESITLKKLR
jgi:hypothetical protein